jgi:predicted transcriptional regulator
MPPKEGNKQLNIHLPEDLAMQLTALAAAHDGSKSAVIEQALRTQIEGTFLHSATDALHQNVASGFSKIEGALQVMSEQIASLSTRVQELDNRLRALEDYDTRRYNSLLASFDRLKGRETKREKTGVFGLVQRLGR